MTSPTRSFGLLEGALAARRAALADSLIPDHLREGRLLDLGCGPGAWFLAQTRFREKVGVDGVVRPGPREDGVELVKADVESTPLPFPAGHFSVITMLAVLEHLSPDHVQDVLSECHRLLAADGVVVLTCPAAWTAPLFRVMAGVGLLSRCEIDDHKATYRRADLAGLLARAGFRESDVRCGWFELGANNWATGVK
jgi:SAM-dependent methyltransferase